MVPTPRMPKRPVGALLTCALLTGGALVGCSESVEPDDGDLPLVDTLWTVESYDLGDGTTQPPADAVATVLLTTDGEAVLRTGCNTTDGRFDAGAGTISLQLMGWTEVGCHGEVLELEEALRDVYSHGRLQWAVAGDLLTLEPPESVSQDWIDLRGEPVEDTG